ncbi:hypothetical protein M0805_000521 [Coniferiporia weirii]|nr:hypothetical protein M0805_000521 [Coniferiporia weirii]
MLNITLSDEIRDNFQVEAVVQALSAVRSARSTNLCSLVLYAYDFVVTYDCEVIFMWGMKFGLGKFIYFTVRYYTLAILICIVLARFRWISSIIFLPLTEITLSLRLYAMYKRSRKILITLAITTTATFLVNAIMVAFVIQDENSFLAKNRESTPLCIFLGDLPLWLKFYWVPTVLNESFMLALALNKAVQDTKERAGAHGSIDGFMMRLVLDSIFYFFVAFVALGISWVGAIIKGPEGLAMLSGLSYAIGGAVNQRLLLRIRERYAQRSQIVSIDTDVVFRAEPSADGRVCESLGPDGSED